MIETLSKLYIFEGFKRELLEDILQRSRIETYKKNHIIIHEGANSDRAYIIIQGMVSVKIGENIVNTIFEGDIFGEIALVTKETRTASIIAETDLQILSFDKETLLNIINHYPDGEIIKSTILNRILQNIQA